MLHTCTKSSWKVKTEHQNLHKFSVEYEGIFFERTSEIREQQKVNQNRYSPGR